MTLPALELLQKLALQRDAKGEGSGARIGQTILQSQQQALEKKKLKVEQEANAQRALEEGRKYGLDMKKLEFEELKNVQAMDKEAVKQHTTMGENTAKALGTAAERLRKSTSTREKFQIIGELKELQKRGVILQDAPIPEIGDALGGNEVGVKLGEAADTVRQRYSEGLKGQTQMMEILGGGDGGLAPEEASNIRMGLYEEFRQKQRTAREGASTINVDSPTTGERTKIQDAVREGREQLRDLRGTVKTLRTSEGRSLFSVQSKFFNMPAKQIRDAFDASSPQDRASLETLQRVQQGVRFAALSVLNRFSGKAMTDQERKFIIAAVNDPDGLSPTQITEGMSLLEKKLSKSLSNDLDYMEKGFDIAEIRREVGETPEQETPAEDPRAARRKELEEEKRLLEATPE
jgi:hypothetical protein